MELNGDVLILNQEGKFILQIAIENSHESIIKTIIESDSWKDSLRKGYMNEKGSQLKLETPMRQLIRYFPKIAETVLNKCRKEIRDVTYYNFEFLEDTFKYKLVEENEKTSFKHVCECPEIEKDQNGNFKEPYTYSEETCSPANYVQNHPLMIINNSKHRDIFTHEVTRKLINNKWKNFGSFCYYTNFFFYCGFLAALTIYIASSMDLSPQLYPNLYTCSPFFNESSFENADQSYVFPEDALSRKGYIDFCRFLIIWFFGIFRLLALFFGFEKKILFGYLWKILSPLVFLEQLLSSTSKLQFLKRKSKKHIYIFYYIINLGWSTIIDISVYISAILIAYYGYYNPTMMDGQVLKLTLRPCWAWQMSAATITLAWINLLTYMRQMPIFVLYINILSDIIFRFIEFMVILGIFIIAFAFGFQVLFYATGNPFGSFEDAFLKTMIMMSGEFDYGSLFYPDGEIYPDDASSPFYPRLTYAFFMVFFILISVIMTNLIVVVLLFFVNNMKNVFEITQLNMEEMKMKYVLNIEEFILNSWIINSITRRKLSAWFAEKISKNIEIEEVYMPNNAPEEWFDQVLVSNLYEDSQNEIRTTIQELRRAFKNLFDFLIHTIFSCESNSRIANICLSVHLSQKPLSLS